MKTLLLVILTPLLLGGAPVQNAKKPNSVNWTTVIVAALGTLTASVPAYFSYKAVKKRRSNRKEKEDAC